MKISSFLKKKWFYRFNGKERTFFFFFKKDFIFGLEKKKKEIEDILRKDIFEKKKKKHSWKKGLIYGHIIDEKSKGQQ